MVHWLMPARRDLVIQIAIAIIFALIVAYVLKKQEADSWSERVTPFIFKIGQESATAVRRASGGANLLKHSILEECHLLPLVQ